MSLIFSRPKHSFAEWTTVRSGNQTKIDFLNQARFRLTFSGDLHGTRTSWKCKFNYRVQWKTSHIFPTARIERTVILHSFKIRSIRKNPLSRSIYKPISGFSSQVPAQFQSLGFWSCLEMAFELSHAPLSILKFNLSPI